MNKIYYFLLVLTCLFVFSACSFHNHFDDDLIEFQAHSTKVKNYFDGTVVKTKEELTLPFRLQVLQDLQTQCNMERYFYERIDSLSENQKEIFYSYDQGFWIEEKDKDLVVEQIAQQMDYISNEYGKHINNSFKMKGMFDVLYVLIGGMQSHVKRSQELMAFYNKANNMRQNRKHTRMQNSRQRYIHAKAMSHAKSQFNFNPLNLFK